MANIKKKKAINAGQSELSISVAVNGNLGSPYRNWYESFSIKNTENKSSILAISTTPSYAPKGH